MIAPSQRTANFNYAIRNIVHAAETLERAGRHVTYLNIGDPQAFGFRPPAHVVEAVQRALAESFTGYAHSTGLVEAREAVANYTTQLGAPTMPDEVIMTSGASEAAELVLTALVNPGDEVLLPAPGYPLYPAILNKLEANPVYYTLDEANGWQPSIDQVRSLITKRTKALVLINPNNPTGSITPDATTSELLEMAADNNLLVIADEVYRELCFVKPPTASSVLAQTSEVSLVTLESLSKTHMIPGWRVGWMRFTNADKLRDLITAITRLASGRLCSPTPTQYAVKPALTGGSESIDSFVREIRHRRDSALDQGRGIAGLFCVPPDAAFYMMIKVDDLMGQTDESFVLDALEETGVLVVHGSGFGCDPADGYFRLVYLADSESLTAALSAIDQLLQRRANRLQAA
ncbi:MAG: pyridoxal phosphate-dependent aminotransferase [Pyrinomonadaceae bacterium]